jgi:dipeptidyl aminopeptidase/acylaminoacyl peptidase
MRLMTTFAAVGLALALGIGHTVARPDLAASSGPHRYTPTPEDLRRAYQRAGQFGGRRASASGVYKAQITPHWFQNNTRFWYRNDLRGGTREFVVIEAERGTRGPAFDHAKLAAALSQAAGADYKADRLPFDAIEFVNENRAVRFKVDDTTWTCDLTGYVCSKTDAPTLVEPPAKPQPPQDQDELDGFQAPWFDGTAADSPQAGRQGRGPGPREAPQSPRSPDGKWTAFVKEHNVYLRPDGGGEETRMSDDGKGDLAYGMLRWAPDSKTLVAFRIEPGDRKEVYLVESSPAGGGRARLHTRPYPLPGDKFTAYEMNLFAVADRKQTKPAVDRIDFGTYGNQPPRLRWNKDGHRVTYEKVDRGHQRFRLVEVDTHTGTARNLIDEKSETFIWTAHTEGVNVPIVSYLDGTEELIYASERDGWRHLYLIDAKEGKVKNPITKGPWVVRGVDRIDEAGRQVWFRASGKNSGQDPYFVHFYRVNFDGTDLVALTEGDGNHTVQYSPDRKYLIDTYSRVDSPPAHKLRRVSDGKLVRELEEADVSELRARGWEPPEVFATKGRDATTFIWGIICRPRDFDPNRRYPVIEQIYAGPQGSFVPKTFSAAHRFASLTELGFIVVQIDGMGTANRSKAFHDVCWKNLKDAGFPDRILWHQAVGRKYPYYDLSRVGITGGSAGGQNAMGGVLFHPDFYKVAVAGCGCHDNRMDKASWNEQWMGYPVGPQYAACSNVDNARRLRGKLLLIVGEMDTNVPPESTLRVVDALVKANKDFDVLMVPGAGHGMGGVYGQRRLQDFFVRHLHGVEPPDRNAAPPERNAAGG